MEPLSQFVQFPYAGSERPAYLARPEGTGPFPAVVVIHEIYGLNENIKDIARRLAREGYVALAVDLFAQSNRAVCMMQLMTGTFLRPLRTGALTEAGAALSYLAAREEVDGERIGAIGFCMGGGIAIAWACTDHRLKAIAPYYGTNPRPLEALARSCPVVGSYPGHDFTARSGRKLDRALDGYGVAHDITIYPDTRHSFFNDEGKTYDAAASADSWRRVLAFFGERLDQDVSLGSGDTASD